MTTITSLSTLSDIRAAVLANPALAPDALAVLDARLAREGIKPGKRARTQAVRDDIAKGLVPDVRAAFAAMPVTPKAAKPARKAVAKAALAQPSVASLAGDIAELKQVLAAMAAFMTAGK